MKLQVGKETVLIISDTQIPFHHPDAFEFLKALKKQYKPTQVVHIGDVLDQHALSFWDQDPDGLSAGQELEASREHLEKLYKLFPKVKVCTANHDCRVYRKAVKAGIPKAYLKDYNEWFGAPKGWEWDDRHVIDGIVYTHGDSGGGGIYAARKQAEQNMRSTVIGHFHSNFQIHYMANSDELVFGMGVGSLIDHKAYAFNYGKKMLRKCIMGTGVVVKGLPVLHPMLLNEKGRWIGEL